MKRAPKPKPRARIFTVGHSNRKLSEFLAILDAYKLKMLLDVRTVPKSRHNPQFGEGRLRASLERHGIRYRHVAGLGGFRRAKADSKNMAWRNLSFRGYADYMQTDAFKKELKRLMNRAKRQRFVLMCSEAVPWRCHRSLIADALVAHGLAVEEIFSATSHRPHKLTPFARVRRKNVTYPG